MLRANPFLLPAVTAFRRGQSHAGHRALVVLAARNRGRLRDPYDTPLRDGNRDRLYGLLTQRSVATLLHYLSVRAMRFAVRWHRRAFVLAPVSARPLRRKLSPPPSLQPSRLFS